MTEIHEYNLALQADGRASEVNPLTVVVSLGTGLVPVTQVSVMLISSYLQIKVPWPRENMVVEVERVNVTLILRFLYILHADSIISKCYWLNPLLCNTSLCKTF
jgi:hypothetical protein